MCKHCLVISLDQSLGVCLGAGVDRFPGQLQSAVVTKQQPVTDVGRHFVD